MAKGAVGYVLTLATDQGPLRLGYTSDLLRVEAPRASRAWTSLCARATSCTSPRRTGPTT